MSLLLKKLTFILILKTSCTAVNSQVELDVFKNRKEETFNNKLK